MMFMRRCYSTKVPLPRGYWNIISNQRQFIIDLTSKLKVSNSPETWPEILTRKTMQENGGGTLHNKYKGVRHLLTSLFPEKNFTFNVHPRNYWDSIENQREFLDGYMKKNGMNSLEDWYKVNVLVFRKQGGRGILQKYNTFFDMLQRVYPDFKWDVKKRKQRPYGFWKEKDNRVSFIKERAKEIGINTKEDWRETDASVLFKDSGVLPKYYGTSKEAIEEAFPELGQVIMKYRPKDYWKDMNNQRKFFNELGKKLHIMELGEWNSISTSTVTKNNGYWVPQEYRTLLDALKSVYPEYNWEATKRIRVPRKYWNSKENAENFLKSVETHYKVKNVEDWYRVSLEQIKNLGGAGLLGKYKGLPNVLQEFYPNYSWDKEKLKNRRKRSSQRWLFLQVKELFPNYEVIEDFISNDNERKSGICAEYDIYIPKIQLAFEYQGYHHYHELPSFGSLELYKSRDKEKVDLSNHLQITLIIVPYTWDGSLSSLKEMISISNQEMNNILPQ